MATLVLILAILGVLAGAFAAARRDVPAAAIGVVLVGLAVLLPLILTG